MPLGDKQFESFRRVTPGRSDTDRATGRPHSEEYAMAVVDANGNPVVGTLAQFVYELLDETRRTNRLLELLVDEEVSLDDAR